MPENLPAEQFAKGLASLLEEYSRKTSSLLAEIRRARDHHQSRNILFSSSSPDWKSFDSQVNHLEGALFTMTREASQLAEQGAVDDLTKMILRVRRAELEG